VSDIEDEDHFMAAPTQFPTWAEKTLEDGGELVDDPADTRGTRSQFFWAPQDLDAKKPLIPIHFYRTLGSYPHSHYDSARNPLGRLPWMKRTLLLWTTTHGTWFHFRKEERLFNANGYIEKIFMHMVRSESKNIDLSPKDTHRYTAYTTQRHLHLLQKRTPFD
jgi:hypothetical protein